MCTNIATKRTISMILTRGNVAIKCAAALKGSGSLLSSIRLMNKCTGRKVSKNKPANAITSFLVIEENKILLIGY
jgi:hypothetical protein